MSGLQRRDYILRQVQAVAEMLARMAGLRAAGRAGEARVELERAYGLLLGSQDDLLRRVDSHTAAMLLGTPDRVLAFARLSNEEARLESDPKRASGLRLRATELGIEAARAGAADAAVRDFLAEISPRVERDQLPPAYREEFDRH